jgi:virginiamycin B lyase
MFMMSRFSSLLLTSAACLAVVTVAVHGQDQAGGEGRQGGRGQQAVTLPDGEGKQAVQAMCGACHGVNLITGSTGYTRERWQDLISTMVKLSPAQAAPMTQYLATHFPPKPGREPVIVAGPTQIAFKEWIVPTLGQRSRDPLMTPDGMIYYAGQYGSLIGRINPRTGEMKEWKLDPKARPHSIINDRAGNIWYTGNANATIGKLNPATGDITVYPMPDPAARDPHTPVFGKDGTMLFFSLQQSNMIGRLDTRTGEVKLITVPTTRALPYGMRINSQGTVWISYNGSNKVAELDPVTMALKEHVLPRQGTHVRRLAIASDDTVWFVNSGLGAVGRLNPKTGEVKEWPSPSGPDTHPYAIEVIDDIVWYNESRRRPDALVRFDPKTEKFQSWAIPSGYGIVRNMAKTPDGNLLIHQTSSNRIGLVTINKPAATTTTSSR